jgi:hypothetical protein
MLVMNGVQPNPQQMSMIAHHYKLLTYMMKVSVIPFLIQERTLVDGTRIRMVSSYGVDTVMVWPTGGSDSFSMGALFVVRAIRTSVTAGGMANDDDGMHGWYKEAFVTENQINGVAYDNTNPASPKLINSAVTLKISTDEKTKKKKPVVVHRGGVVGLAMREKWESHIHYGTGVTLIGNYVFVGPYLCAEIPPWDDPAWNPAWGENKIRAASRPGVATIFVATSLGIMRWTLPTDQQGKLAKITDEEFIKLKEGGKPLPQVNVNTAYIIDFENTTGRYWERPVAFGVNGRFVVWVEQDGWGTTCSGTIVPDELAGPGKYKLEDPTETDMDRGSVPQVQNSYSTAPAGPQEFAYLPTRPGYSDQYGWNDRVVAGTAVVHGVIGYYSAVAYTPWSREGYAALPWDVYQPPELPPPQYAVTWPNTVTTGNSDTATGAGSFTVVVGNAVSIWGEDTRREISFGDTTAYTLDLADGKASMIRDTSNSWDITGTAAPFGVALSCSRQAYRTVVGEQGQETIFGPDIFADRFIYDGVTPVPTDPLGASPYNNGYIQKQAAGMETLSYSLGTPIEQPNHSGGETYYITPITYSINGFITLSQRGYTGGGYASESLSITHDNLLYANADTGWMVIERWKRSYSRVYDGSDPSTTVDYAVDVIKARTGKTTAYRVYERSFSGLYAHAIREGLDAPVAANFLPQQIPGYTPGWATAIGGLAPYYAGDIHIPDGKKILGAVSTTECIMFSLLPGIAGLGVYDSGGQLNADINIRSIALAVCDDGAVTDLYELVDVPDQPLPYAPGNARYRSSTVFEMTLLREKI